MSIFPYIYFMVDSFHITTDEHQIGLYAGLVTAAFAFAEFSTGMFWGHVSDKIGRKPILIMGLVGTFILVVGIVVGILFLEETHREKKFRRDIGLEIGQKLLSLCHRRQKCESFDKCYDANLEEAFALLEDEPPPGYRTTEGSPRYPASRSLSPTATPQKQSPDGPRAQTQRSKLRIQQKWTKSIILHIVSLGFLAFQVSTAKPSLPFHFVGGFGMSSKDEGILMVMQGFYAIFAQGILFPGLAKRFSCLQIFRAVVTSWPVLYFLVPYIVLLPQRYHLTGICFCLLWRTTAHALTFPSINVMIANNAPSRLVLGSINGAGGSAASFSRALGPTMIGLLHSKGLSIGISGLGWWATGLVCALGAAQSYFLENGTSDDSIRDKEVTERSTGIDPLSIDAAIAAVMRPEDRIAQDLSPSPKYIRDPETDPAA
ncbi:MAG: hypothetical protein Q9220_004291 [cf. Caloplaca sp. 1 TL-2023]